MPKRIDTLVAALSYDPLQKDYIPMLLVGMGDPQSKKNPLKVVNTITGSKALDLWSELIRPRKDDPNGGERNASN